MNCQKNRMKFGKKLAITSKKNWIDEPDEHVYNEKYLK